MLHNDHELFRQIILSVADATGIIEKDYYVTMFLKKTGRKAASDYI